MSRAFLVVMDSVGIGGAPDADTFFNGAHSDAGANTIAHIAAACAEGRANKGRRGPLHLPYLNALGLGAACRLASGAPTPGLEAHATGAWGAARAQAIGKDTHTGHWELAGLVVPWQWHYFPRQPPVFPHDLVKQVCAAAQTSDILGNCHASGTAIVQQLGKTHIETGFPICYTSADSVFQIAAHEHHFGLQRLLTLCETLAPILHHRKVGRVIARPFVGDADSGFHRTKNRRDFALPPPGPLLTNWVQQAGGHVYGLGKIGDIFSMRGIDTWRKGSDAELMAHLYDLAETAAEGSLIFANFVEFDTLYGHPRDPCGYARALEWFDTEIGAVMARLREGDLLLITADHGNDPTWEGSDHTREQVPVLCAGVGARQLGGLRFIDVGASVAHHLGCAVQGPGRSFLASKGTP